MPRYRGPAYPGRQWHRDALQEDYCRNRMNVARAIVAKHVAAGTWRIVGSCSPDAYFKRGALPPCRQLPLPGSKPESAADWLSIRPVAGMTERQRDAELARHVQRWHRHPGLTDAEREVGP